MDSHDIIVIGASAGGIEALTQLVARLPADLPASVFVVVHIPAHAISVLPKIFNRSGPLRAEHAGLVEPIRPGRIYVARPDHHMLIHDGRVRSTRGPKENGHRPAVDPLFRSAALAYGPRVVAAVLSGSLDDGTAGLAVVKEHGGVTVVQSPEEALYPSMPRSALLSVPIDHVLTASGIADLFARLAVGGGNPGGGRTMSDDNDPIRAEVRFDELDPRAIHGGGHPGTPSGFGCPDCGGTLWELSGGAPMRYRCRVGHAWTAGALLARQADAMESALWTALRALEERAALCRKMAERFREGSVTISADRLLAQAAECVRSAEVIRALIAADPPADAFDPDAQEPPSPPGALATPAPDTNTRAEP